VPTKDFQRHMAEHIALCEKAKEWARKAIERTERGDYQGAKNATAECTACLHAAMEIEKRYKLRNPHEDPTG
jgi:hypothetical protein